MTLDEVLQMTFVCHMTDANYSYWRMLTPQFSLQKPSTKVMGELKEKFKIVENRGLSLWYADPDAIVSYLFQLRSGFVKLAIDAQKCDHKEKQVRVMACCS